MLQKRPGIKNEYGKTRACTAKCWRHFCRSCLEHQKKAWSCVECELQRINTNASNKYKDFGWRFQSANHWNQDWIKWYSEIPNPWSFLKPGHSEKIYGLEIWFPRHIIFSSNKPIKTSIIRSAQLLYIIINTKSGYYRWVITPTKPCWDWKAKAVMIGNAN